MSKIIGDEPCPDCRSRGRDTTGNHLMRFEDGGAYCNRCGFTIHSDNKKSEEEDMNWMDYDIKDVLQLPLGAIKERKISAETYEHFRTRLEYNTTTGEVDKIFYPYVKDGKPTGYKVRKHYEEGDRELKTKPHLLGEFKCFRAIADVKGILFNQAHVPKGAKRALLVEGEEDALAAYEMLKKYKPYVLSIPSGATINKDGEGILDKAIVENLDYLKSMKELVLCFDQDAAGKAITKKLAELIGPSVSVMDISNKDASDVLTKGNPREFVSAFFSAKHYAPEGFVTVDDVFEEATRMPEHGRPWPWPTLNKLTYGRRDGEGAYFGAGVKMGKSEAVNQIAHYDTQVLGDKIALFKLEEKPSMTVRKVAGKIAHKQFHIPDGDFTQQELIDGVKAVGDKVILYDSYGSTAWDDLKVAIRHAVVVEGAKTVIIDPLTRLTTGMNAADANTELERVADEISKMAKDLGFFYIFFCHLKAPQTGKPHEEGGKVHSNQFTGSRAMMRACYFMIGIERDKTQEDEVARNTSTFVLLEDRAFGNAGRFEVYYDRATGDYLEPTREFV